MTDEPLGLPARGKVACRNGKSLALGNRNAHASNIAKRGGSRFVLMPTSLGQPPESAFDRKNFIRKLIRGMPVKRNSYTEFVRWLQVSG